MKGRAVNTVWRRAGGFLVFMAVFALVYTQAPLYTSNQNLYFLPGLAQAGYGDLSADWLATRTDSMPLFSALVNWTYRLTHLEALFYVYYALLMGVYVYSALGIVRLQVQGNSELSCTWAAWVYLALFTLVHSAAWRFLLGRTLGDNWMYILEDGVADQRLLGTVFQPSAFGVLLVLSIYLFLKERPYWAVVCAALAASFHPTYLLGAAALTAAYVLLRLKERWPEINSGVSYGQVQRTEERASHREGEKVQGTADKERPLEVHRTYGLRLIIEACLPGLLALLAVAPILVYTFQNFASPLAPPPTRPHPSPLPGGEGDC